MVEVNDDHDEAVFIFAEGNFPKHPKCNVEIIPEDNIELIKMLVREIEVGDHGSSSEAMEEIFERARERFNGIWIGGNEAHGRFIEEALKSKDKDV
jgi:hypothetical protein